MVELCRHIVIIVIISSFIVEVVIRNFHIHIIMVHCYLYYKQCHLLKASYLCVV